MELTVFEKLLLEEVKGCRADIGEAKAGVAALQATITADQRYCGNCKEGIQSDIDELFTRTRSLEDWRSAHDATVETEEKGDENERKKSLTRWQKVQIAIVALGSIGGVAAVTEKVLKWLGVSFK